MCVILAVNQGADDITTDEFFAANYTNSDGFGMAWLDNGLVKYVKTTHKDADIYSEWRPPKPYVMHFRIATVGGTKPELCHPFVVSKRSPLKQEGTARRVLFHNGHWGEWNKWLGITFSGIGKLPQGAFSDSRTMALMVGHYGDRSLDMADAISLQRIALLDANGDLKTLGEWDPGDDGVMRSNENHIWGQGYAHYSGYGWVNPDKKDTSLTNKYSDIGHAGWCQICEQLDTNVDESGVCNYCRKKLLIPGSTSYSRNNCQTCFVKIPDALTICGACEKKGVEPRCTGPKCDKFIHVSSSLATKLCFSCFNKASSDPTAAGRALRDELKFFEACNEIFNTIYERKQEIIPYSFVCRMHLMSTDCSFVFRNAQGNLEMADIHFTTTYPQEARKKYSVKYRTVKDAQ